MNNTIIEEKVKELNNEVEKYPDLKFAINRLRMAGALNLEQWLTEALKEVQEEEIVICAAVKTTDGQIIRGHRHNDCLYRIASMKLKSLFSDQGFVTSRKRYVDRKEGLEIQLKAGSPVSETSKRLGELYSEDLY